MNIIQPVNQIPNPNAFSWTAVTTGALVNIGFSFLQNVAILALGLYAYTAEKNGSISLAIGGFLIILISSIIIMYLAGWVAGYLGVPIQGSKSCSGILYGFVAWCLALTISLFTVTQMGDYVSAYSDLIVPANTTNPALIASSDVPIPVTAETATPQQQEQAAKKAGTGLAGIFILFLAGAIASSYGGHCGMCKKTETLR